MESINEVRNLTKIFYSRGRERMNEGTEMTYRLVGNLQKLGFTGNEAKIYSALVLRKQFRARDIAEIARVPRPKIYRILRGMEEKGYVRIIEGEPTLFCCVRPEELIFRIRTDFMFYLNETASELSALNPTSV